MAIVLHILITELEVYLYCFSDIKFFRQTQCQKPPNPKYFHKKFTEMEPLNFSTVPQHMLL